jgi:3-hydroxyacyl-CoA dehydrogenase
MHWAEAEGLARIVARLDHWHGLTGREVFAPAPLLRRAAEAGRWPERAP